MCDTCRSYMDEGFTHAPDACPLLQAAYCSYCLINGHYMSKCPNHPKPRTFRKDAIPSVTPVPLVKPIVIITHNNLNYIEHLSFYGIEPKLKIEENKELLKQHLAKNGYELADVQSPAKVQSSKNVASK